MTNHEKDWQRGCIQIITTDFKTCRKTEKLQVKLQNNKFLNIKPNIDLSVLKLSNTRSKKLASTITYSELPNAKHHYCSQLVM